MRSHRLRTYRPYPCRYRGGCLEASTTEDCKSLHAPSEGSARRGGRDSNGHEQGTCPPKALPASRGRGLNSSEQHGLRQAEQVAMSASETAPLRLVRMSEVRPDQGEIQRRE